ncbi:MAG: glycosyltransferase family 39 protein [Candidatus Atribacteria bacterium]|nr:glycosyltransferase family 39 protein [Candidatus Atribacteria bacterium]
MKIAVGDLKIRKEWLLAGIFALGIFVRFFLLGVIPPGLNQDEASIGYDAWAMLHYGIDRNGFHNPIHLVSWGSGQNALYAYLSMPFIRLLGLNVFSVRFLNALMGSLSLFLFYDLMKNLTNKDIGTIALFLLAISPWHIMMSRWGLESNIFPGFVLLGTWLLVRALRQKFLLPLAFFVFALSLYAYGTAYFFVPVFLFCVLFYLLRHDKVKIKTLLLGSTVFILVAIPVFLFVFINLRSLDSITTSFFSIPRLIAPRFGEVSSLFSKNAFTESLINFRDLLDLLFLTQHDGLIWNGIPAYGYLFLFSPPFLLFGFLHTLRNRKIWTQFSPLFFLVIWFLVAVFLGIVTRVNVNRVNAVFLPAIGLVTVGISFLREHARTFFRYLMLCYFLFFLSFLYSYFFVYPINAGPAFFESLGEAIQYALKVAPPESTMHITDTVNMPYVFVLFYERTDPRKFLQSVTYVNPEAPFRAVQSFGRYHFGIRKDNLQDDVYIFHNSEAPLFENGAFTVHPFRYYSVAIRNE